MSHSCTDWSVSPPVRKLDLLIVKHDDERVYVEVPDGLKSLEQVVRTEFKLGDVDIAFYSSCANLCDGSPAKITEAAWARLSPYIGCVSVKVCVRDVSHEGRPSAHKKKENEPKLGTKRKASDTDASEHEQSDHEHTGKKDVLTSETVREEQRALSDHGNSHKTASAPEGNSEEEVSVILPQSQRSRIKRRHLTTEDEDENESEQDRRVTTRSQPEAPPIASPPKPAQPILVKREKDNGSRSQVDAQPVTSLHQPSKPIKQEKLDGGSRSRPNTMANSQPQSQVDDRWTQTQIESNANQKLMIRVAHRPSKQESKFTTKSTTKVAKVLGGACKSFDLDPNRATMYLIVATEDENGEEENLFPCDRNDTIARAGAEYDTESRFLLKMAGEV